MKPVSHLLLMPPNWIGDAIMAQPAMRAICAHYAEQCGTTQISVCGRAWLRELLPWLDLPGARFLSSIPAADTAFLFPNSIRSAWQCRRAGVAEIIAYRGQWRSLLLSRALPRRIDPQHQHHRDFHVDLAVQNGIAIDRRDVLLRAPEGAATAGVAMMRRHGLDPARVICIAPGAQFGAAKCYPPDGFRYVVGQLAADGWQPLLLGMPEDRQSGAAILDGIAAPHWNAAGETALGEALQLIAAARLMLCNDSGLMHVAAGLGIPTVAPFGATDPARTAPSGPRVHILYRPAACSPCLQRECSVSGHLCMANITPAMLLDACNAMLGA
jgi:heptosyltransferase-2